MSCPSRAELVSCGSGTWLGEYPLKGLRDFGISNETYELVWAGAVAVRQASSPTSSLCKRLFIASPPHRREALDSPCRSPPSRLSIEWCANRTQRLRLSV